MGDTTTVPDSAAEAAETAASTAGLGEAVLDTISAAVLLRSHPQFDERVLDAYAGDGASALPTAELVSIGGLVDAVEPAESLVEAGRERAGERMPQLQWHVADPADWEPTGYDLVQCVLGLGAFDDAAAGVHHLIERARPGGRVVIATWSRDALDPLPQLLLAALPESAEADSAPTDSTQADSTQADSTQTDSTPDAEDAAAELAAGLAVPSADTAGSLAHWLTELGLVEVRADSVQRHLDLTPELAWALVEGTGLRGHLRELDDAERDAVRERFERAVADLGERTIDASVVIAVGRRPDDAHS